MANPFSKGWKYLMALFDSKIEEHADPKVQIQQAIEHAQQQHDALSKQAANVIANQRQLEMKLNRQLAEIEKLQGNTRQALELAEQERSNGREAKALEYENAAEAFAAQLVTAEQNADDLKGLHDQSLQAAHQAKQAVDDNSRALEQQLQERTRLLSQLDQAKMQEQVAESVKSMQQIGTGSSPNLDQVRDKIEQRYARALGSTELHRDSMHGRMREVERASVTMAGHSRLEEIRSQMAAAKGGSTGSTQLPPNDPQQSITQGE